MSWLSARKHPYQHRHACRLNILARWLDLAAPVSPVEGPQESIGHLSCVSVVYHGSVFNQSLDGILAPLGDENHHHESTGQVVL